MWLQANKDETVLDTKYNVMKLEPDQIYEFRIAAENKAGVGPASELTIPTQAKECVGEHIFFHTCNKNNCSIIYQDVESSSIWQ